MRSLTTMATTALSILVLLQPLVAPRISAGKIGDFWPVIAPLKKSFKISDYSTGLSVSLKFADRVGEILTASPRGNECPAAAISILYMRMRPCGKATTYS